MSASPLVALALVAASLLGCGGVSPSNRVAPAPREPGRAVEPDAPSPPSAWIACESGAHAPPARRSAGQGVAFRVEHQHRMSRQFEWTRLAYAIDGRCVQRWEADQLLEDRASLTAFDGALAAGPHRVDVYAQYRLDARPYGVFATYVRAYTFDLRSHHDLSLEAPTVLRVIGDERGTAVTPIEERPRIRYEVRPL